jgi:hypothetical protein
MNRIPDRMRRSGHSSRSSLALGLLVLALLGLTSLVRPPVLEAQEPVLTARVTRVLFPLVTEEMCDAGRVQTEGFGGSYAVHLEVSTAGTKRGWALAVQAEQPAFRPEAAGKPCSDLLWKLDHESAGAYRPLDDHETIVLENAGGGDLQVTIDFAVRVGWKLDPGTYELGLVFRVVPL